MRLLAGLVLSSTLVACAVDDDSAQSNDTMPGVLTTATAEPPGSNCPYGGTRVDVGVDRNGNGILDPSEIQSTFYVCAAEPLASVHEGTLYITSAADMAA